MTIVWVKSFIASWLILSYKMIPLIWYHSSLCFRYPIIIGFSEQLNFLGQVQLSHKKAHVFALYLGQFNIVINFGWKKGPLAAD